MCGEGGRVGDRRHGRVLRHSHPAGQLTGTQRQRQRQRKTQGQRKTQRQTDTDTG